MQYINNSFFAREGEAGVPVKSPLVEPGKQGGAGSAIKALPCTPMSKYRYQKMIMAISK